MNLEKALLPKSINRYLAGLKAEGVSQATIKRKAAALRRFSQWAEIELGISNKNPKPASSQATSIDKSKAKIISAYQQFIYKNKSIPAYFAIAFAATIIVAAGIFGYEQLIKKASPQLAYPSSPTSPQRVLSFQGRFTDAGGTPIDDPTSFTYKLWKTESAGTEGTCAGLAGEDCLWTSTCTIDPDEDGIFAARLGDTGGSDNECGPAIPSSLFSENTGIWLEITVGGETLDPRQPIATSAYALNAETLQGLPLGTGTSNVAYIDSNGNIGIGVTSPSIDATSSTGTFGIKGQALLLQTPDSSDGDITINPDGTGVLNLTFEGASPDGGGVGGFVNATNANITSGALYYGEVASSATDYQFLNFSSGTSPTTKFSVGANGTTYIAGNLGIGTTNPGVSLESTGEIQATKFAFQDDSNTYIDTIAEDTIAFAINNATQFVIDSNGNVGVGTTSPANKLDVDGTVEMTGLKMTTSPTSGYALVSDSNGVGTWQDISSSAGPWTLSGSNLYPDSISYNVGIGTTNPGTYKLNVAGNTYLGGNLTATGTITFSGMGSGTSNSVVVSDSGQLVTDEIDSRVWGSTLIDYSGSSADYIPKWSDSDTLTNSVLYETNGNIGVGTTAPEDEFDIRRDQNATTVLNVENQTGGTGAGAGFRMTSNSSQGFFAAFDDGYTTVPSLADRVLFGGYTGASGVDIGPYESGADIRFFTGTYGWASASNERMRIDSNGNIGIGTTNPDSYKLNVAGNMYLGGNLTLVADGTVDGVDISDYSPYFIDSAGSDGQLWRSDGSGVGGWATLAAGTGIGITNSAGTITINHSDTSSQTSEDNSDLAFIQDVSLDGMGHVTGLTSTAITATNGLTATGTDVELGGTLEALTTIDQGGYDLGFYGSGNVGIGTTSPHAKIDIQGGDLRINRAADGYGFELHHDTTRSNLEFEYYTPAGIYKTPLVINYDGNVGIGTTAPSERLDVSGDILASGVLQIGGASSGLAYHQFGSGTASEADIANAEDVYISGDLEIDGTLYAAGISGIIDGSGTANYLTKWQDSDTLTDSALYEDSGNIGIGTTAPGAYKLTVAGSLNLSSGSEYYIDGSSVLSSTTLGSGVVTSSLTTVGALGSGSITSGFGSIDTGADNIVTTGTMGSAGETSFTGNDLTLDNQFTSSYANTAAINLTGNGSGITFGGTGVNQIITGGTNDLAFMAGGNIGIGTTAPAAKLEVNAPTDTIGVNQFKLTDGTTGGYFSVSEGTSGAGNYLPSFFFVSAGVNGYGGLLLGGIPSGNDVFSSTGGAIVIDGRRSNNSAVTAANILNVRNYGTSLMVIDKDGNVGIGTTVPNSKLHVAGNAYLEGNLSLVADGTIDGVDISDYSPYFIDSAGSDGQLWRSDGSGVGGWATLASGTGIGITNSSGTITINHSDTSSQASENNSDLTFIQDVTLDSMGHVSGLTSTAITATNGLTATGSDIELGGTLEKLTTIDQGGYDFGFYGSGNVGIGTTATSGGKLTVAGSVNITSGNAYRISGSSVLDHAGSALRINNDGIATATSVSYGNFGIGTTAPSERLDVSGDILASGVLQVGGASSGLAYHQFGTGTKDETAIADAEDVYVSGDLEVDGTLYAAGISGVTSGSGTANYIPKWSSSSALTDSILYETSGNIGIGTTAPTYTFEVRRDQNSLTGINIVNQTGGTSAGAGLGMASNSSQGLFAAFDDGYTGIAHLADRVLFGGYTDASGIDIGTWEDGADIRFYTGNYGFGLATNERMRIDSNGNVGIGTTNPGSYKLNVAGNMYLNGNLTLVGNGTVDGVDISDYSPYFIDSAGSDGQIWRSDGSGVGGWATLASGTGIGITNSSGTITINHSDTSSQTSENNSDLAFIQDVTLDGMGHITGLTSTTITATNGLTATGTDIELGGTLEKLTAINQSGYNFGFYGSGNVGIGTTGPGALLHLKKDQAATTNLIIENDNGAGVTGLLFNNVNGDRMFLRQTASSGLVELDSGVTAGDLTLQATNNGNVGIGTTAPSEKLDISGDILASGVLQIGGASSGLAYHQFGSGTKDEAGISGADDVYVSGDLEVDGVLYGNGSGLTGVSASTTPGGSDGQVQYNNGGSMGGASNLFYNDSINQVGIGTTAPYAMLDTAGAIRTTGSTAAGSAAGAGLELAYIGGSTGSRLLSYDRSGSTRLPITYDATNHYFNISGTERMRINSNGNVGIGTTNPATKLNVSGGALCVDGGGGGGCVNSTGYITASGLYDYEANSYFVDPGSANVAAAFSGNVGVGTTSPGAKLEVVSASGSTLNIKSTGAYGYMKFLENSTTRGYFGFGDSGHLFTGGIANSMRLRSEGAMHFGTNGDHLVMTLDSSYNVGIGTTSPSNKLEVAGGLTVTSNWIDVTSYLGLRSDSGTVGIRAGASTGDILMDLGDYVAIRDRDDSYAEDFRFDTDGNSWLNSGNVGIGTTSPGALLEVYKSSGNSVLKVKSGNVRTDIYSNGSSINMNSYNDSSSEYEPLNISSGTFLVKTGSSAGNIGLYIDADGKVGIGTASQTRQLDVIEDTASGQVVAKFENTGATSGAFSIIDIVQSTASSAKSLIRFIDGTSNSWIIGKDNSRGGIFGIGTGQVGDLRNAKFAIDTSGNVGIGTTSPTGIFDINGYLKATSTSEQSGSYTAFSYCSNQGSNAYFGGEMQLATPITPGGTERQLTSLRLPLARYGIDLGTIVVEIQTDSSIDPSGTIVSGGRSSIIIPADGSETAQWYYAYFDGVTLAANTKYWLVVYSKDVTTTNTYRWKYDATASGTNCQITAYTRHYSNNGGDAWSDYGSGVFTYTLYYSDSTSTTLGNLSVTGKIFPGNRGSYQSDAYIWSDGSNILTNTSFVTLNTIDLAEVFPTYDPALEAGDVVSASDQFSQYIEKANSNSGRKLLGVVSTNPGLTLGKDPDKEGIHKEVALSGRVPVKIAVSENQSVEIGNNLTQSSIAGVGKKQTNSGETIGTALQSFIPAPSCQEVSSVEEISWPEDNGRNETQPCYKVPVSSFSSEQLNDWKINNDQYVYLSKVIVLANLGTYDKNMTLDNAGELVIEKINGTQELGDATANSTETVKYVIKDSLGNAITSIGAFAETVVGKITAGLIKTDKLVAESIVSPIVETEKIKSSSPSGNITIDLENGGDNSNFGSLLIKGEEGATIASIDGSGNATFSGQIAAESVKTNSLETDSLVAKEASFSSVYIDNLVSKEGSFGEIMAGKIASVREELEKLIKNDTTNGDGENSQTTGSSLLSQAEDWDNDTATGSANISLDSIDLGEISLASTLIIQGQLSVEEAFINKGVLIGNITIGENSISTLSEILYLQPSGQGKIDFLSGAMVVEESGNVAINGNLDVNGRIAASEFSGRSGDFNINLAKAEPESGFGSLIVKGEDGKTVASIDSEGSASFEKLNISADATTSAVIASQSSLGQLATSSAEIKTNASAGTGEILANQTEVVIYSEKLTKDSMVYITPTSDSQNQVLYVKNKNIEGEKYFTVAIGKGLEEAITFNWWIIN